MALSKTKITGLLISFIVILVIIIKVVLSNSSGTIDPVAARSIGPEQAKVNIVEFIDLECPACAHGAIMLKDYVSRYPQSIHLQIKYFPLMNIHRHAMQVAAYAECVARQGKFWPFFDSLMPQQPQWSPLVNAEGIFDQIAKGAGVDMSKLKSCIASDDVSTTIMNEKALGRSLSVQSTPTYFINNKMIVGTKSLTEELNNYFPNSAPTEPASKT
jgi:protein-disulfide isomerase